LLVATLLLVILPVVTSLVVVPPVVISIGDAFQCML
jgi:hypothetical protein